jgi:predicted O-methyltransferase YrrM
MAPESKHSKSWFSFVQGNFEKFLSGKRIRALQIGVYRGDATEWLLRNCEVEVLFDVDSWTPLEEYGEINMQRVELEYDSKFLGFSNVTKLKMLSDGFFLNYSGKDFDFIYIDGDHSASQTALDGINAWKHLSIGGILAFDDYEMPGDCNQPGHPKRGIDCFLTLFKGYYIEIERGYQIWVQKI